MAIFGFVTDIKVEMEEDEIASHNNSISDCSSKAWASDVDGEANDADNGGIVNSPHQPIPGKTLSFIMSFTKHVPRAFEECHKNVILSTLISVVSGAARQSRHSGHLNKA